MKVTTKSRKAEAALLLLWSRTLVDHMLPFEKWLKQYQAA